MAEAFDPSESPMRTLIAFTLLFPLAAQAQTPPADKRDVGDVVTQPVADVNLKKKEIPVELLAILDNPYDLTGVRKCRQIIREVKELNAVLGPDLDEAEPETQGDRRKQSALSVVGGVIGGLIPFRFLVREISGANKADREYRAAIYAGVVRRGFLKGYGKARRCLPPGSPRKAVRQAP